MSKWLIKDINKALEDYPSLTLNEKTGVVSGSFPLTNPSTGEKIEEYDLRITFPSGTFINKLPRVWETSERLPRLRDRHIYDDGEFCLASSLDAYLLCREGVTFLNFLEDVVSPFLASQTLISLGEPDAFPQGQYSHGEQGILESYQEYFGTQDLSLIVDTLSASLRKIGRNTKCFCGSGKKFKYCHAVFFRDKPLPPVDILKKDLRDIQEIQEREKDKG